MIRGALVIFYKGSGKKRRFCVTTTSRGGNTVFPGGARERRESAQANAAPDGPPRPSFSAPCHSVFGDEGSLRLSPRQPALVIYY